ncbi:glycosyltransferase family 39 protein [Hymenobacter sp. BT770]|uniref:glycosyltransferase family 39 protein n=1 Tax=Hymenobacter sp. BT770 TaxID=2886942 RepID=UPI001D10F221|nr:glycosyltransferase family 39 protein [Hymenobacter sp. BT770]MCC3154087.1 glycosyltransferase family 39 protein [Hymenobacter sp. BT770]MDO3416231.1 glycosyltransferase family 39 protein [Hymenobacter sp. BT770]
MRSFYVWLLTAALAVAALVQDQPWNRLKVFSWDPGGYYAYLPSAFIYHDLGRADSLQHLVEKYGPEKTPVLGIYTLPNGRAISKYPLGLAVGELPWFWGAHLYAKAHSDLPDGFSRPYQQSMVLAGLAYGLLGLWVVRKLLLHYFDDRTAAWALAGVGLGTNFYNYATFDAPMAHGALFMWQAAALYCTVRWHETFRWRWAAGIGLFLGMAVLCRFTEMLYVLIPLTWGITSLAALRQRGALLASHAGQLALMAAIGAAVLSLQFLFWKATSGHWLVDAYSTERFDFRHPHVFNGLFSFRKGWFLYTPLALLMLLGLNAARRAVPAVVVPALVLLPVLLYVTFSWEAWWYGGGFSARPLVSLYPLLALPLAALLLRARQRWESWRRQGLHLAVLLCIGLNLWQTWQYASGLLMYDNNTPEMYRRNFFHTPYAP